MKRKILIIAICTLLISLALPTAIAEGEPQTTYEDDVEISISAGFRNKDFGFGVAVNILNHKTEDVNVFINLTLDYIFTNDKDGTYETNETALPEIPHGCHISPVICYPDGIKFITVTTEVGGTIVTRSGISIRNLVILFK